MTGGCDRTKDSEPPPSGRSTAEQKALDATIVRYKTTTRRVEGLEYKLLNLQKELETARSEQAEALAALAKVAAS